MPQFTVCDRTVKNASGRAEVRNAKDAIDAYKNITDAINAAEKAANEAKAAAENALNVSRRVNTIKILSKSFGRTTFHMYFLPPECK